MQQHRQVLGWLSVFFGAVCGGAVYLAALLLVGSGDLLLSLVIFLFATGALYGVLLLLMRREEARYAKIEARIPGPIFLKIIGNFEGADRVRSGRIYFTDRGIVVACLDGKFRYCAEIPLSEIAGIRFDEYRLEISTKDDREFWMRAENPAAVREALREKNWIL